MLYTDGLTEARRSGELFGPARVKEVAETLRGRSCQGFADGLRDAALAFAGRFHDDLMILAFRLAPQAAEVGRGEAGRGAHEAGESR